MSDSPEGRCQPKVARHLVTMRVVQNCWVWSENGLSDTERVLADGSKHPVRCQRGGGWEIAQRSCPTLSVSFGEMLSNHLTKLPLQLSATGMQVKTVMQNWPIVTLSSGPSGQREQ